MAVTLNQLSSFLAVAREGSVSAAAEKLYVTQPSISAAVSALSKELGVELTERVGRGVGLTAAGTAFRPYAADVLGLIDQGKKAAREAADVSMRSLRIVASLAVFLIVAIPAARVQKWWVTVAALVAGVVVQPLLQRIASWGLRRGMRALL